MSSSFCTLIVFGITLYLVQNVLSCADKNSQCAEWAARLECEKNPPFMLPNCANSCNQCKCGDNNTKCQEWANRGECAKNPNFMKVQCRMACKMCVGPAEQTVPATPQVIKETVYVTGPPKVETTTSASFL